MDNFVENLVTFARELHFMTMHESKVCDTYNIHAVL